MMRTCAVRLAVVFLAGLMTTACSTVRPQRSSRTGLLATHRAPAKSLSKVSVRSESAPPSGLRAGWLQISNPPRSRDLASLASTQADELEQVRHQRWRRAASALQLKWPLSSVEVTSPFGIRHGDAHEGIDLRAAVGTPVFAAHDGVVLYSGSGISGYGRLLVLKHSSGLSTVYGHNSRLLVTKGQRVRRGQRIALSGNTGRSSGPHLHFEVRAGLRPVDPMDWVAAPPSRGRLHRSIARVRSTLAAANRLR